MYRQIAKLKRGVEELMMKDMQKQITKLTHQLMEARSPGDREKSDHGPMTNFEDLFQRNK